MDCTSGKPVIKSNTSGCVKRSVAKLFSEILLSSKVVVLLIMFKKTSFFINLFLFYVHILLEKLFMNVVKSG